MFFKLHILNYLSKFFQNFSWWIPTSESCITFFCIPFPFAWSADAITCQSRTSNAFAYMEIFIIFKMFKSSCRRVASHRPHRSFSYIFEMCGWYNSFSMRVVCVAIWFALFAYCGSVLCFLRKLACCYYSIYYNISLVYVVLTVAVY